MSIPDEKTKLKTLQVRLKAVEKENKLLKQTLQQTLWMAAEYAKKDRLFSAYTINMAIDNVKRCGVKINCDYISDEYLGPWSSDIGYFLCSNRKII